MSSAPPTLRPITPQSAHREDAAHFVRWALAQLGLTVHEDQRDLIVELPEADRVSFAGQQRLRLPLTGRAADGQESLDPDGRFLQWLAARLHSTGGGALHARPLHQPMTVADVTGSLFSAYHVDGGQVHLAGCQLTDHPFLRLSFAGDDAVHHFFVAPDGSTVSDELVPALGLDQLEPIAKLPPRLDEHALRSLVAAGRRMAARQSTSRDPSATTVDPVAVTILWVRHAEGRLQFTIGKQTTFLPFSSWAKLLQPKPYLAPHSGANTFHLAATDDGRIDAAEQIALCQQSGRRVLRQELVQCSVTGKHVLADFTEPCPVSGLAALKSEFVSCTNCKQHVSKAVMQNGACQACRSLARISKDDPRLVWIFAEHPGLDRWKHWQLAETQSVYIAVASSLMKRLLLVVEKETLAVRRLAAANRISSTWIDASEAERNDYLK